MSACRGRPFRGLAFALFALFGLCAPVSQAMLLTVYVSWSSLQTPPDNNLQVGSIIQVIGYRSAYAEPWASNQNDPEYNFPIKYGQNTVSNYAAPYNTGTNNIPETPGTVYLADTTPAGHDILYTGAVQDYGSWYGLYTQFTVDTYDYDYVYIRVFGATDIAQGAVTASYWGVSDPVELQPNFQTQTLREDDLPIPNANYFEVIPEPATLGLMGLGGCALAAWRRRRFARPAGDGRAPEEEDCP